MRTTLLIIVIASCVAIQNRKNRAGLNAGMLIIIRYTWAQLNEKTTPSALPLCNTTW